MLTSFADVFSYLATRYTLATGGASSVELWWRLAIDGEHAIQHQLIGVDERDGCLAVTILCEVHCFDPTPCWAWSRRSWLASSCSM
jgi:hypothetical protein